MLRSNDTGAWQPVGERIADDDVHLCRCVKRSDLGPTRGLGDIAMRVLVAEVAEHSEVGAPEHRPERLHPVRVCHASHILSDAVLYALVWSVQAVFGRCFVGAYHCSWFRPRLHGVCQYARIGAIFNLGRHLVRLTVSVAYYSLVTAMDWTVDIVFRVLERRFVTHSMMTGCVLGDEK